MKYDTIRWRKGKVELIDQRLLPAKVKYAKCSSKKAMFDAIKKMKIRGAPAIGIAGAYGAYLGIKDSKAKDFGGFKKDLSRSCEYIASSRPTARNLFWAIERIERVAEENKERSVRSIKKIILTEAHKILEEDKRICRAIGKNGSSLIKKGSRILTHCNAGGLATGEYGTALGVIFASRSKIKRVYADETRPVLQGARLTVWELLAEGIPTTLICDNMAASLMAKKKIDLIIVGADRIASNGDAANKIGTYGLAVLARHHKIPFYVAAPSSTFDLSLKSGREIPIEERDPDEVRKINNVAITVKDVSVCNPAFDVTPAGLVTAIITEKGIIKKPTRNRVLKTI